MPTYTVVTVWNISVFRTFEVEAMNRGLAAKAVEEMIEEGTYEMDDFSEATGGVHYDHIGTVREAR